MAKVTYGVATFRRARGRVDCDMNFPMDGVIEGGFVEFLANAGENGWELCATFPSGVTGENVAQPDGSLRKTIEPTEEITFIFKKL